MSARKGAYATLREIIASLNSIRSWLTSGLLQQGTLAIHSTPEQFKTTTVLVWRRGGMQFSKAAATALAFSAAHPVTADKFGAILVQVSDAGVISTKISGATQTTTQAYDSAEDAVAALPSPDAGNLAIGWIIIEADGGGWVAITDDLTDASDLTSATFVDADVAALPAAL